MPINNPGGSTGGGGSGTVTEIDTGTGLTGGPITTSGSVSLANTAVTPGTYGNSTAVGQFTVDQQGRITLATNVTIASGGSGTVTQVNTSGGVTGGPITGTGTITLTNVAATAHQWVDSVVSNSLHLSQPAAADLSNGVTGSGAVVLATNATLVTPALGTPSSVTLTNGTGLPFSGVATGTNTVALAIGTGGSLSASGSGTITATAVAIGGITGLGTGVAAALADNVGSAGAFVTFNGALGTPSSGTLTNATGLPITGITGLGTGVAASLGTANNAAGGYTPIDGTATMTNKRMTFRSPSITQAAAPAINTDVTDYAEITGLAQAITSMTTNLSGTPVKGDRLWISFTDNGTARGITWGTSFESSTVTLPTTTVISTRLDVGCTWNVATSKWRCVAVA